MWEPIETAPKDREIVALSPGWEHGKSPVMLKWYKYNGAEAWRDYDGDAHNPTHWQPLSESP